jgi:hydroxypyruvate reductase
MSNLHASARTIWEAALARVAPAALIERSLALETSALVVSDRRFELDAGHRVRLLAVGKAADALGRAAAARLGGRLAGGLIVTKDGHAVRPTPFPALEVFESGHPLPDERSLEAGARIARFLSGAAAGDLLLLLLSGGASALAVLLRPPLTLDDLKEITRLLMHSGATIQELNAVRKHLDLLKGGGLLRLAAPARIAGLLLSDVVGDALDTIASGPAVPDPSTFGDARDVLARRGLLERAPRRVIDLLDRGMRGEIPETVKPGDPLAGAATIDILARGKDAVTAAAAAAESLGFHPHLLGTEIEGEAREVGRWVAAIVRQVAMGELRLPLPAALLWGGETTVTVHGGGQGGRNQELALAAAIDLSGLEDVCLVAIGTDGTDGPTDAAGGIVDGETAGRARARNIDLASALAANDSYNALAPLDALVITKPTGTHVNDLGIALVGPRR